MCLGAVGALLEIAQGPAEVPEMVHRVLRCGEAVFAVTAGNSDLFEGEQQQPLLPACAPPAREQHEVAFVKLFGDRIDVVGITQGEGLINGCLLYTSPSPRD